MTNFYKILPTRKMPISSLTYSCEQKVPIGQIVDVPIQSSLVQGLVLEELSLEDIQAQQIDPNKLKPIYHFYPYTLNLAQMEFLKVFAYNTFNSPSTVLQAFLQPYQLLTKKQIKQLETNFENAKNEVNINTKYADISTQTQPLTELNYLLESDIIHRIRYIIRSQLENIITQKQGQIHNQILIIFPEKKYLANILGQIKQNQEFLGLIKLAKNQQIELQIEEFSGQNDKNSRSTISNLLQLKAQTDKTLNIIFSTRAGVFLPFNQLKQIILIDEANSFYIQDQNRLYFDTREAVFMMYKAFSANLSFISRLPSVRLHNLYSNKLSSTSQSKISNDEKNDAKIKITQRAKKYDEFELFSDHVTKILRGQEEEETFWSIEEE